MLASSQDNLALEKGGSIECSQTNKLKIVSYKEGKMSLCHTDKTKKKQKNPNPRSKKTQRCMKSSMLC